MARNYPDCQLIFNSTFLIEEAEHHNSTPEEVRDYYTEEYKHCEYNACTYIPDTYVYSLIACYSIILPIGFFGNLAVILTVLSVSELRIVMNLLLVAMAFSDLIITIAIPFTFLHNISYNFEGPVGICRATPMIQGTAIMSGIYTLVVIAIERYNAIVHILRPRIINSPFRVAVCVGVIWLVSACFQIPLPLVLDVESWQYLLDWESLDEVEDCPEICFNITHRFCVEIWSPSQALAFSYAVLVTLYIVPLICLTYLYSHIGYFLWKRRPVGIATVSELRSYRRKKRLVIFLVVLVVTFAVLWGPYFILQCVVEHVSSPIIFGFIQVMGHSNVAVNPILYAYFHRRIRKHAIACVRRVRIFHRHRAVKPVENDQKNIASLTAISTKPVDFVTGDLATHGQNGMISAFSQHKRSSKRGSAISYQDLLRRITNLRRQSETLAEHTPELDLQMANDVSNGIAIVAEGESLETISGNTAAIESPTRLPDAGILKRTM